MRNRILPIFITVLFAGMALISIQYALAAPGLETNTGITINEGDTNVTITNLHLKVSDPMSATATFTYTILTPPQNGTLTGGGTFTQDYIDAGSLKYTHNGSETTSDSFEFNVTNGITVFITSTFNITINPVNDPPNANPDTITVAENGTATTLSTPSGATSVTSNDTDAENGTLTVTLGTGPSHSSSFTLNDDGTFTYTQNGDEDASDSFTYTVCDNGTPMECDSSGSVTINITPVNDTPVATNDNATVNEGSTVTTPNVLNNDSDDDIDDSQGLGTLTASIVTSPTHYSAFSLNPDGSFSYTHDGSETPPTDSFTYKVCDDELPTPACDQGTVNITINPVNDIPVATNDNANVDEGGTVTTPNVLNNDSDDDLDDSQGLGTLKASIVTSPTHYSAFSLNPDGSFSYTHNGSENFSDSFTYKVCDDESPTPACDQGTVNITINPVNDIPVATNDNANVDEGGTVTTPNVLNNDSDDDVDDSQGLGTLTASIVSEPTFDSAFTLNPNGAFIYTHDGSENFSDSFTYKVCDDESPTPACDEGTVNITINPVNDAPVANNDTLNLDEGASKSINVVNNDSDADSAKANFTLTITNYPDYDTSTVVNGDNSITYTHDGSENHSDNLTYQICDDGVPQKCDTAVVTININPVNDAPKPQNDNLNVSEGNQNIPPLNVLANDSDDENDTLTTTIIVSPTHAASYNLTSDGMLTYQHDGSPTPTTDSITYQVCDDGTPQECSSAVINISISFVNDPPTAVPDTYYLLEGQSISQNVKGNDYDEEGDGFVVITPVISPPSHGVLSTFNSNGSFTYVHSGTEDFSDNFVYRVCKNSGSPLYECTQTTVTLVITPTNDAPTTAPDIFTVPRSETLDSSLEPGQTSVISNDTDAEGDNLVVNTTPVTPPTYAASFTLNADGTFIYVHNDLSDNDDSFTYRVCDDGMPAKCSNETVTINIGPRPTTFIYLPVVLNNYSPDEPNNGPCTAYPISLGSSYSFAPNDTEDWYRITLPSTTNLNIEVTDFVLTGDLIVYKSADCIIDGNDDVRNDGTTKSSKTVNWANAPAGTYYIRIYTSNPNPAAQAYKLSVNVP